MRQFGGLRQGRQEKAKVVIVLGGLAVILMVAGLLYVMSSPSPSSAVVPVSSDSSSAQEEVRMVELLVPVRIINAGDPLDPSMFRKESRPQIALGNVKVISDFEEIQGQYASVRILKNQPLLADNITSVRPTNAITAKIPEGFRAVTISVDARSSVEGFALPGAKVDVIWASRIRDKPGVTVIVQNAEVLSAERQVSAEANPGAPVPSTVTLLVNVEDAQKIQLASTTGSLSLSLRGDADVGKGGNSRSITVDDLLGGAGQDGIKRNRGPEIKIKGPGGKEEIFVFEDGKLKPLEE